MICIDECDRLCELFHKCAEIDWEEAGKLYTKDYWALQYRLDDTPELSYCLGASLTEEVVACLLGGYGMKAELGLLAFHRLKNMKLINSRTSLRALEEAITQPFRVNGRETHYRFPGQKASYIQSFLQRDDIREMEMMNGNELRDRLLTVKGIGLKTASWIARNYLGCDDVAIIDIHIYRAGRLAGFIAPDWDIKKDYYKIEESFLCFCESIKARPSRMDNIIWNQMKESSHRVIKMLNPNI